MHELSDEKYSYRYIKTIRLLKGKPVMEIMHSLKNTGLRRIETDVYNHNFFWIDKQAIGPDYTVEFPFRLSGKPDDTALLGKLDGKKIIFLKELARNRHLHYQHLTGYGKNPSDYNIKIDNQKAGAGVLIKSDKPLSRVAFWSHPKAVCPAPYTHIRIEPGETFQWNISYEFYARNTITQ